MIKPICERGVTCIFLDKKIEDYSYPIHARSEIMKTGKRLSYRCKHPKVLEKHIIPKRLTHEKKFKSCELKTTNTIGDFYTC